MSTMSDTTNKLTGMPVTDAQLRNIANLAQRQVQLEAEIEHLEKMLSDKGEQLQRINAVELPDAMMAAGMESFTLKGGAEITISKFYQGKIPDDKRTAAFEWLRSHGLASIIKRQITSHFGMGEDAKANKAFKMLAKLNPATEDKTGVHPMTLKALIREKYEAGEELPTDLFGVHVGNISKVTPPKQ